MDGRERAFAFMFDAVSSHGKWWLTKKIGGVEKRRKLLQERLASGKPALVSGSTCVCSFGGVITITMPGAMRTTAG